MIFHEVKRLKGSELIMEQIKQRIVSGELAPGDRVATVTDLADQFGVGRSTVREALSALKAMGWLDIRHGGGTFVSRSLPSEEKNDFADAFSRSDSLKEVLEVRKVLETSSASFAAERRSEDDLVLLEAILREMQNNLDDESIGEEADVRFHAAIAKAAGNNILQGLMETLSQSMRETMKDTRKLWFYGESGTAKRLLDEHQGIFEAIRAKDEAQAVERMRAHLQKVESVLIRVRTDSKD